MRHLLVGLLLAAASGGIDDSFSRGMDDWWTEGAERVWVAEGRLNVKADPPGSLPRVAATVWHRRPQPADFSLELEAHVILSSTEVNNINLFFCYNDPAGRPLQASRDSRAGAAYNRYHTLNGYIVTFVNDPEGKGKARIRIRRNPGFHLLAETFAYHCRRGITYHLALLKRGGEIRFSIDGSEILRARDPDPLPGGYFGLRTFRTWLWWDNVKLKPI